MRRESPALLNYGFSRPRLGAVAEGSPSVDEDGPVDKLCASLVDTTSPQGQQVLALEAAGLQSWSYQNFGVPYYAPSLMGSIASVSLHLLGAFVGGYHGHMRSGGKTAPMLLWGLGGYIFPLPVAAAAVITGYGKRAGSKKS